MRDPNADILWPLTCGGDTGRSPQLAQQMVSRIDDVPR